jgi:hypothetical protein
MSLHIFFKMFPTNSSHQSSFETNAFLVIIEGAMASLITLFLCGQFAQNLVSGSMSKRQI